MIDVIQHSHRTLWQRFKLDLAERFLNFETVNGLIYILWGAGFIFYGWPWHSDLETFFGIISRPQFGYNYALMSVGAVLILWGVRKVAVNRVKQHLKVNAMMETRKGIRCYSTSK